jgi:NADH-quinone oxidoreductase subunit G
VAHGLKNVKHEHGANSIAGLASAHSTLEELSLLSRVLRGLGSDNIETRLRQSDFALTGKIKPWLGMSIAAFAQLKQVFVIGSFLRKDHPLLAARLRQAVKSGTKLSVLHATDDELLMKVANKAVLAPSAWLSFLAEVATAVAITKQIAKPSGLADVAVSDAAQAIATSLLSGTDAQSAGVFLGNTAAQHPDASKIHALAQWIAQNTGAGFGYLTEAANTVGAYLADAVPSNADTATNVLSSARKAVVLLNAEPSFDFANANQAQAVLAQADMVVVMSAFKHGMEYADVLLPISPFTETAGTFVNCEGRAQSFHGVVKPLGDTRPAWKVLRVLGNLLGLDNFEFETAEAIRDAVLGQGQTDLSTRLNNIADIAITSYVQHSGLERVSDVPIYSTDAIVRRSESLQRTADAKAAAISLSAAEFARLGIADGEFVKLTQAGASVLGSAKLDKTLPATVVRVAAGVLATHQLGAMFGPINVERA